MGKHGRGGNYFILLLWGVLMNVAGNGSQTASVIGTEYTLHSTTTAGVYSLLIDTAAMTNTDTLLIKISVKVVDGGADRVAYQNYFSLVQSDPAKLSVPVVAPYGITCSITQIAGTGRAFPWVLASL